MDRLTRRQRYVSACGALFDLTGVGCCVSCDYEADEGYYSPIEIESPGRRLDAGRFISEVCCAHAQMRPHHLDPSLRPWWAILLRHIRNADKAARARVQMRSRRR